MKTEITMKTNPDKILKLFRDSRLSGEINLKTSFGYIYLAGGILSKLEGNDHFIAHKGRWVLV